jgi:CzcA family heavy metal efflux pump
MAQKYESIMSLRRRATSMMNQNPSKTNDAGEHWSARHSKSIIFLILTGIGVGIYLAFSMPIAVFPSTDFPRIVIGVDNGVMPIEQMLVTVTRPIEQAVNTVQGLERIRSITSRGTAEVSLFFNWDVDMFQTLNLVNGAIAENRSELPSTAKVSANRLTFAAFPIMGYSLTSDSIPQTALWELATYDMMPRLNRLSGVSSVVVQGGQEPEYEIRPDPAKLLRTSVTVPGILEAIQRTNMIDSPGMMQRAHELVLALVGGQVKNAQEISDIVVKTTQEGVLVRVADIASVNPSHKPVYTIVTADAKPAVLLNIFRQPTGNTVKVADEVHREIESIRKSLPHGVNLGSWYDQSGIVNDSINSVRDAILVGLVLASLILVLFLRDWGTSFVAGLVIPATVALTFIVLRVMGESFNLMTLGGLAAAVGLVIDDAIVVVENIIMHRDSGQSRGEAVRSALSEIKAPLIGSTLTPIVVFLPLISITGVTGVFFRSLALTVGVALLTSLALALTWTPTLSHFLIRKGRARSKNGSDVQKAGVMARLGRFYGSCLRGALRHPLITGLACLLIVAASYLSYRALGSDLLPRMDEGGFILDYYMPAGSSLEDTNRVLTSVEEMLRDMPEVESTSRRTGVELGLIAVTEANTGDFAVKLKRNRSRGVDEIEAELREKIEERFPMLDIEFVQLLQDMIGDLTSAPEPIEIKLFCQNQAMLREWAPKVAEAIEKIDGVVDVLNGIDNTISGPAILFQVNPAVATRAGFSPEELEVDTAAILEGEPAPTPVVVNERAYTIRVRFPETNRASLDAIRNTVLGSSTGQTATLGSVSNVVQIPGQMQIRRDNLQTDVAVTAGLEGLDLGTGIAKVQQAIQDLHLPPAIRVAFGGAYEEQQKSFHDLFFVLALAILFVFIVLLFEFGDFAAPLAILASALLSTSGVFIALLVTRITFNISSFMGLIMVIGIVAKNGILLIDADKKYRREGMNPEEAMIAAGERRLRPIMMTALATIAGMIPLSLAIGAGSQMLQPLAIAVIGGIAASMVLSLIVTPAVNFYVARSRSRNN